MSRPDATASAALDQQHIRPAFFCYLDIVGDPLRATTAGQSVKIVGSGDPDLDDHEFTALDPTIVDIGPVRSRDGGSDSVTAKLSGIVSLDADLLNLVGDRANWQGRTARLWRMIRNAAGEQQGVLQHYYTGWMTGLSIEGDPTRGQTINLTIQSYLAAYSQASNRTYMDQEVFDPGDLSARAAIAIANGNSGSPLTGNTPMVGGGGLTSAQFAAGLVRLF